MVVRFSRIHLSVEVVESTRQHGGLHVLLIRADEDVSWGGLDRVALTTAGKATGAEVIFTSQDHDRACK